ncbi:MAG TPA: hypothetical protein VER11_34100 [Polyangiaceae bacterium]|nr:hypothetical protein [Polyangiaceae bacterium]
MRKSASFTLRWVLIGSSLAALGTTHIARGQTAHGDRNQNVVFDDDLLNGDLAAPFGTQIFPPHLPPARVQLIRPRTNFLPELYKSVEHL